MEETKEVYVIKKTMVSNNGKKMHVFLTDNYSEVLEMPHKNIADKLAEVMSANSDSGWSYEVVVIKNKVDSLSDIFEEGYPLNED